MKHEFIMKTPDVIENLLDKLCESEEDVSDEIGKITDISLKYFRYGELVTLVIDTDAETISVKEKN